jgi:hypothetical protein
MATSIVAIRGRITQFPSFATKSSHYLALIEGREKVKTSRPNDKIPKFREKCSSSGPTTLAGEAVNCWGTFRVSFGEVVVMERNFARQ